MVLVQKLPFFQLSFFRQYSEGKYALRYSRTKKRLFRLKKEMFKKSKNWHFSKGVNLWFWSKNGHFFKLFFWGDIGQENILNDILEQKNAFKAIKTRSLKGRIIDSLLKGLTHGFGPKMAVFPTFYFS